MHSLAVTVHPASATNAFLQDSGPTGVVSIEAEHFQSNTAQGGHSWTLMSRTGASGEGAMEATPNKGTNRDIGYTTTSPNGAYAGIIFFP
jgi:hypothetical protein